MSRGLGTRQRLILSAIEGLALKHGRERWYTVAAMLREAHALSGDLQLREAERQAAADQRRKALNASGERGRYMVTLEDSIRASAPKRHARNGLPRWIEKELNPTRTLALLERRGLIERRHGAARLIVRVGIGPITAGVDFPTP